MARGATDCCDRRMRRTLAAGLALPVALTMSVALSGCNGDDQAAKAGGGTATESSPAIETPTGLPTALPTDLPTGVPTDLPTDVPTTGASEASGAALDGCSVVTPEMIRDDFGADPGQAMSQPASLGDPTAKD